MRARQVGRFSLVELLVVAAVIVILAALLLPALAKTKEQGRKLLCANNLKQLARAAHMYVSDSDDYLMNGTITWKVLNCCSEWGTLVSGYLYPDQLASWNAYRCDTSYGLVNSLAPGSVVDVASWLTQEMDGVRYSYHCHYQNAYGINPYVVGWYYDHQWVKLSRLRNTSAFLFAESGFMTGIRHWHLTDSGTDIGFWHGGAGNFALLDGAVLAKRRGETGTPTTNPDFFTAE